MFRQKFLMVSFASCLAMSALAAQAKNQPVNRSISNRSVVSRQIQTSVNINRANVDQLQQLKGIGPKRAQAIVAYRAKHGAFKSLNDLLNIKGVGPKRLAKIRTQLKV